MLTSCSTKATLDGVVFTTRSTGYSFMHMAAATAVRKGTKLKACVLAPGAVVLYLSSALACTWFALLRDSQAHTSGDRRTAALMMTTCNQPQICCTSSAGRTLQVFLQVSYMSSVQVPCRWQQLGGGADAMLETALTQSCRSDAA